MNIKEIISDYRKKRRRAALLLEKYDELKDRATTPASACNYGEIKTKSSSGREHLYIKMLTAREKWQNAALDELEARQRLFDFVMMLEDPDEMDILYLHFIDGHTIKNIFSCLIKMERHCPQANAAPSRFKGALRIPAIIQARIGSW